MSATATSYWVFNSVFLDNGTLRSAPYAAEKHCHAPIIRHILLRDNAPITRRAPNRLTRSVRRASDLLVTRIAPI
jgi:hypothetical protein